MVVGLREGRGANALKVHLRLKLKDGGRSSGRMRSECAQGPHAFANVLKVFLHLKLKVGGRSSCRTRSECAQGPPAFAVERWWSVFGKNEERMRSRSTCI